MPLAANSSSCPLTRPTSTRLNRPSPSSSTSCARRRPAPWRPSSPPPSRPIRASPPAMPTDSFGAPGITYENRSSSRFSTWRSWRQLSRCILQCVDMLLGGGEAVFHGGQAEVGGAKGLPAVDEGMPLSRRALTDVQLRLQPDLVEAATRFLGVPAKSLDRTLHDIVRLSPRGP